jgi:hypothetical protein
MERSPSTCPTQLRTFWLALVVPQHLPADGLACAFQGLTIVSLPFTTASHNPPTLPDDVLEMLHIAQPQVLILPAGLALDDVQKVKSIKANVVVDISAATHMNWNEDEGDVETHTWTQVLGFEKQYEPAEKHSAIAIQAFIPTKSGFKSVEFTHQVMASKALPDCRMSLPLLRVN